MYVSGDTVSTYEKVSKFHERKDNVRNHSSFLLIRKVLTHFKWDKNATFNWSKSSGSTKASFPIGLSPALQTANFTYPPVWFAKVSASDCSHGIKCPLMATHRHMLASFLFHKTIIALSLVQAVKWTFLPYLCWFSFFFFFNLMDFEVIVSTDEHTAQLPTVFL